MYACFWVAVSVWVFDEDSFSLLVVLLCDYHFLNLFFFLSHPKFVLFCRRSDISYWFGQIQNGSIKEDTSKNFRWFSLVNIMMTSYFLIGYHEYPLTPCLGIHSSKVTTLLSTCFHNVKLNYP